VRVEVGPRDIDSNQVCVYRRDKGVKEKEFVPTQEFIGGIASRLQEIQDALLARATAFRDENTKRIDTRDDFYAYFTPRNADKPEIHGGFADSHWCGSGECEAQIKEDLRVTVRCIPFNAVRESGACVHCGNPSERRVLFGKSY